jgi:hypothetical protein
VHWVLIASTQHVHLTKGHEGARLNARASTWSREPQLPPAAVTEAAANEQLKLVNTAPPLTKESSALQALAFEEVNSACCAKADRLQFALIQESIGTVLAHRA